MLGPHRLALPACAALMLASAAGAQTGPFADGELLIHAPDAVTNQRTLWRVNPVTGLASALLVDTYTPPASGWMAYDPYRDGVLAFVGWIPVSVFSERLYLLRNDASVTELGFADAALSDLAPVGDGRVYLRKAGELYLLDAQNQMHPVLDAGGQPVTRDVRHLVYHAPTNSLIGAMNIQTINPCSVSGSWLMTAHRFPLTPDGTALSGPIQCSSYDHGQPGQPVAIDTLPDGGLLLTISHGYQYVNDDLLRIDPFTLAITLWAQPDPDDFNGGVWAQTLGKALVLDDKDDVLRAYAQGETGMGTVVPVSVPVGDITSGWGSTNSMTDINGAVSTCPGSVASFGAGLAGTGGAVPMLGAGSCPKIGATLPVYLSSGVGKGAAFVGFSLGTAAYPLFGGTGYLLPPLVLQIGVTLSGSAGTPAAGWAELDLPIPNDPVLLGTPVYGQAGVLDAAAPAGIALTPALSIVFG